VYAAFQDGRISIEFLERPGDRYSVSDRGISDDRIIELLLDEAEDKRRRSRGVRKAAESGNGA
jgi:hypothetical protein